MLKTDYGVGSHAVITGATSTSGRAFANRLKSEGFKLILVDEASPEFETLAMEMDAEKFEFDFKHTTSW